MTNLPTCLNLRENGWWEQLIFPTQFFEITEDCHTDLVQCQSDALGFARSSASMKFYKIKSAISLITTITNTRADCASIINHSRLQCFAPWALSQMVLESQCNVSCITVDANADLINISNTGGGVGGRGLEL